MNAVNPLTSYMRQPKIFIELPSKGLYWAEGSIDLPENKQIPVYSMTAKDELMFKTPDALLNGQAVVDVIQSCIPNIKDAWQTPTIDLDTILLSIRLASYGEKMEVTHTVPVIDEEVTHDIDIRMLLDQLSSEVSWEESVKINEDLTIFIRPLTYRHVTSTSLKTFETQRMIQMAAEIQDEEQKLAVYNRSLDTIGNLTVDLLVESVKAIEIPTAIVKEPNFIREFFENADSAIFQKIEKHITDMKEKNGLKPIKVQSTPEQISAGAPKEYSLPIIMDNSDFFGQGS